MYNMFYDVIVSLKFYIVFILDSLESAILWTKKYFTYDSVVLFDVKTLFLN